MKVINTEFEAKFYPVDKESLRTRLKELGGKITFPERRFVRVIADKIGNPSVPFPKNSFLRVRDEGNLIRLSIKVTADETGAVSDQKEVDVTVSDFEKTIQIFETIGIIFNRKQETLREEWTLDGAQVVIDTWPGLETYSEVEADSEESVRKVAEKIGFDWNKKIITAAAEVYAKVYKMDVYEVLKKIQDITFKDNPFSNMEKVWTQNVWRKI